jgi:hypothetical protein
MLQEIYGQETEALGKVLQASIITQGGMTTK